jgi:glucokinase
LQKRQLHSQEDSNKKYVLSLDLGGTYLKSAIIDGNLNFLFESVQTVGDVKKNDPQEIGENVLNLIGELLDRFPNVVKCIGISIAAIIDKNEGSISFSNYLGLNNVPIKKMIEDKYGIPTFIENDGYAAATGEHYFEPGKNYSCLVYVGIGTGLSGGVIVNKCLLRGKNNVAGLIGHMILNPDGRQCVCGKKGCLEAYVSGRAVEFRARELAEQDEETVLKNFTRYCLDKINCKLVVHAARQGDLISKRVLSELGYSLGLGLSNIVNLINPEIIIIGGGMRIASDLFIDDCYKGLKNNITQQALTDLRIEISRLGPKAALVGAAILAIRGCL